MPRLWIFSDLHQEWPENAWDPAAHAPPGGFDVAVVPGDILTPLTSAIDLLADRLPGVPVVIVPGNHEFWWDRGDDRYTLADMADRGRELAARRGVHLLMDDAVEIAGAHLARFCRLSRKFAPEFCDRQPTNRAGLGYRRRNFDFWIAGQRDGDTA